MGPPKTVVPFTAKKWRNLGENSATSMASEERKVGTEIPCLSKNNSSPWQRKSGGKAAISPHSRRSVGGTKICTTIGAKVWRCRNSQNTVAPGG